ncbi:MAG: hypothetical protein EZS28_010876 [Streblomastix strix]|uniref:Uncharacterized protein n=1 Tax=Streblomastix strix TaxID=222440 RepID=A0A5J4WFE0_9EUKA|nr:MAG: hypothetical protein EZS28_010876 [Streblomastix strix]
MSQQPLTLQQVLPFINTDQLDEGTGNSEKPSDKAIIGTLYRALKKEQQEKEIIEEESSQKIGQIETDLKILNENYAKIQKTFQKTEKSLQEEKEAKLRLQEINKQQGDQLKIEKEKGSKMADTWEKEQKKRREAQEAHQIENEDKQKALQEIQIHKERIQQQEVYTNKLEADLVTAKEEGKKDKEKSVEMEARLIETSDKYHICENTLKRVNEEKEQQELKMNLEINKLKEEKKKASEKFQQDKQKIEQELAKVKEQAQIDKQKQDEIIKQDIEEYKEHEKKLAEELSKCQTELQVERVKSSTQDKQYESLLQRKKEIEDREREIAKEKERQENKGDQLEKYFKEEEDKRRKLENDLSAEKENIKKILEKLNDAEQKLLEKEEERRIAEESRLFEVEEKNGSIKRAEMAEENEKQQIERRRQSETEANQLKYENRRIKRNSDNLEQELKVEREMRREFQKKFSSEVEEKEKERKEFSQQIEKERRLASEEVERTKKDASSSLDNQKKITSEEVQKRQQAEKLQRNEQEDKEKVILKATSLEQNVLELETRLRESIELSKEKEENYIREKNRSENEVKKSLEENERRKLAEQEKGKLEGDNWRLRRQNERFAKENLRMRNQIGETQADDEVQLIEKDLKEIEELRSIKQQYLSSKHGKNETEKQSEGIQQMKDNLIKLMKEKKSSFCKWINTELSKKEQGTYQEIQYIRKRKEDICQIVGEIFYDKMDDQARMQAIEGGIASQIIAILMTQPLNTITHPLSLSFYSFTNPFSPPILQQLAQLNSFPMLLHLLDHPNIQVVGDAIASLFNILLGVTSSLNENDPHPYFQTIQDMKGIEQLFKLFQSKAGKDTRDTTALCLAHLFRARKIPNAEMRKEVISHLKSLVNDDDDWTKINVNIALRLLVVNDVNGD